MKTSTPILVLSICALLLGCGHKASDGHGEGHAAHAEAAPAKTAQGGPALTLDGGEKWPMDDHTRASLDAIEARLKAGPATDDVAGHQALGRELDEQVKTLIGGCTMKGDAHDQLHVWLMAFIPAVGSLQEGTDVEALRAGRKAVETHLAAARAHFR